MSIFKDRAIVLRRLDHSETSQVLVFFGRDHGQVRLIAKGIKRGTKKSFAPGVDLLEAGHVVYSRRETRSGLGTLTEWRQIEPFLGLRDDALRLYAAQYAAEITTQLTEEGDPHPELYAALFALLKQLCDGMPALVALCEFQLALLEAVGLLPRFDCCASCQKAGGVMTHFSVGAGGMICRDCEPAIVEKRRVPAGLCDAMRKRCLNNDTAAAAFDLLDYTMSYIMGRPTRSGKYLQVSPRGTGKPGAGDKPTRLSP